MLKLRRIKQSLFPIDLVKSNKNTSPVQLPHSSEDKPVSCQGPKANIPLSEIALLSSESKKEKRKINPKHINSAQYKKAALDVQDLAEWHSTQLGCRHPAQSPRPASLMRAGITPFFLHDARAKTQLSKLQKTLLELPTLLPLYKPLLSWKMPLPKGGGGNPHKTNSCSILFKPSNWLNRSHVNLSQ